MSAVQYPFIDIAVNERIRARFAAGEGMVLFSSDMRHPLWANGQGAGLFGFTSIYDFIDQGPNRNDVAFRQVEATARQLARTGDARNVVVRVTSGFQRVIIQAVCELVEIFGERAVLFSAATAQSGASVETCAARMIQGFEDPDTHIAVFDRAGRVIAATDRFSDLDISRQTVGMLSAMADHDPHRLAKRPISTVKGYLPAAMGKLSDEPATYLLFAVDTAEAEFAALGPVETASETEIPPQPVTDIVSPPQAGGEAEAIDAIAEIEDAQDPQEEILLFAEDKLADEAASEAAASDGTEPEPASEDMVETGESESEGDHAALQPSEPPAIEMPETETEAETIPARDMSSEPEISSPTPETADAQGESDASAETEGQDQTGMGEQAEVNEHRESDVTERPADNDVVISEPAAVAAEPEGFAFRSEARATRFVWKIDASGHFTEVSSEFAATVGPHAADIIGMAFSDLAALFHLDPEGRIIELLNKRDTWSGKTIWWPVEGTSLIVPVDLAALPTYTRSREFDGFRGFGIVRIADAAEDPNALGLTLVSKTEEDVTDEAAVQESAPDAMDFSGGDAPDEQSVESEASNENPTAEDSQAEATASGEAGQDENPPLKLPLNPSTDWPSGERPALRLVENPGRRQSDKIIQLEEHRTRLSPVEQAAFREIARQLDRFVDEGNGGTTEQASTTPAAAQDEPKVEAGVEGETAAAVTDAANAPGDDAVDALEPASVEAEATPSSEHIQQLDQDIAPEAEEQEPAGQALEPSSMPDDAASEEAVAEDTGVETGEEPDEQAAARDEQPAETVNELPSEEQAVAPDVGPEGEKAAAEREPEADTDPAPDASETAKADDAHAHLSDRELLQTMLPIRERIGLSADIIDQMPVALLVHSGDRLIHGNPEFLKLTGYASLGELDEVGGLDALLQRQDLDDKTAGPGGMVVVRADDEIVPVIAKLQSVRWGDNSALMLALMRTAADAEPDAETEALSASAKVIPLRDARPADQLVRLQVEVEELRAILETATDGVVIIDASGEVRSMNRSASALFNYDDDEINGKPFVMLFAHESQRAIVDYLSGLSGHGVASVLNDGREVIGREASGGFLPLFMTIGRLTSSNGYCAVIRDITQWKRTEEELRTAKRAAESANAHKSEFLAHVSHEIRTPLNAIIGFADMMAGERFGPMGHARYVEYSNDIGRSGRHVLDIVNDLLDISKIEAGEMELDFTSVGLNETVSEAVSLVQPQANGQRVIIRTALSQAVPPVVADLRSIKQIVLNILSNAIRFTPSGGQIVVSSAYEPNGNVVLRVRDTGIGMTRSELELAMKPFRQVAGAARKRGDGTGLGLPLTKAMVDANRAAFAISSAPNEGTLVEITFPSPRVLAT